jgi:hypothetical protein
MRTNVSKAYRVFSANPLSCWFIGGPDRDRTDDLFHAILDNTCGINGILGTLEDQKGTQRALHSRKSAPVVPSFSIFFAREGVEGEVPEQAFNPNRAQAGLASVLTA